MRHKEHFLSYLKRNYLNDHGYRGTLTRSLMEDPYIKCNLCNHTRTLKRLKAIGASDGCIKAYLECWEEYQKCENEIQKNDWSMLSENAVACVPSGSVPDLTVCQTASS